MCFNFNIGWTEIISIIGALAWLSPWVYEYFHRAILKAQLVGLHVSTFNSQIESTNLDGEKIIVKGSIYTLMLSCIALHKDVVLKKCLVKVHYQKEISRQGQIAYTNLELYGEKQKTYRFPLDKRLFEGSVIKKDSAQVFFLNFIVEENKNLPFDFIEIIATDYYGTKSKFIFKREEIDPFNTSDLFDHLTLVSQML